MTVKSARWVVSILCSLAASLPAQATPPVCPEPIGVAMFDLKAFYSQVTGQGIDRDLVAELQRRTQCRFDLVFESRVRIWSMLENGSLQMSMSGLATEERRQFADFVPYYHTRFELLTTSALPALSPEAFLANDSLKLGVVHGYRHGAEWDDWILALRQRGRVLEVADSTTLYRQLDLGRIQAMLDLTVSFSATAVRYPMQHPVSAVHWFTDTPDSELGLVMSKDALRPELRQFIADNMMAMRRDGTVKKIFLRYLDKADVDAAMFH
jgi:polar amino acid transport system substrate-binding protein